MKRIKSSLLCVSIVFSCFVIIMMIYRIIAIDKTVELYITESNQTELDTLKEDLKDIDEGECKVFLNKFVNYIEKGMFDGKVKTKDFLDYYRNFNVMEYFNGAKEICMISQDDLEKYDIPQDFVTLMIIPDSFIYKHEFNYEIKIDDPLFNNYYDSIEALPTDLYRRTQMRIARNYIKIVREMEAQDE